MSMDQPEISPFRILLLKIGDNIESNDLPRLRLILEDHMPVSDLEDITGIVLMRKLHERGKIDENRIDFLEELLEHLEKIYLITKYIKPYKARLAEQQQPLPTDAQHTGASRSTSASNQNEASRALGTQGGRPEVQPTLPGAATHRASPNYSWGVQRERVAEAIRVLPLPGPGKDMLPQTPGRPPDSGTPPVRQPRAITKKQPPIYPQEGGALEQGERYPPGTGSSTAEKLRYNENDHHNANIAQRTPPGLTTSRSVETHSLSLTEFDFKSTDISSGLTQRNPSEDYDSIELLKRKAQEDLDPHDEDDTYDLKKQNQTANKEHLEQYMLQVQQKNEQVRGEMEQKHNLGFVGDLVNDGKIVPDGRTPDESMSSAGRWDKNVRSKIHTDSPQLETEDQMDENVSRKLHTIYSVPMATHRLGSLKLGSFDVTGGTSGKVHTDSPRPDPRPAPDTSMLTGKGARPKDTVYNLSVTGRSPQQSETGIQQMIDEQNQEELRRNRHKNESRIETKMPIHLYGYQYELAEPALDGQNCILFALTGSGKTVTAGYVCDKQWMKSKAEGRPFKALFIVDIQNIVNQKRDALRQLMTEDDRYEYMYVGAINETTELMEMLEQFDVIVLTAQVLVECLNKRDVSLQDFNLLIIEECHHTSTDKHPYKIVIQHYHEEKRFSPKKPLPQILGLTASLGLGANERNALQHYIRMCANLDCTKITHVRERTNLDELLQQNPKPKKDQIIGESPRDPNDMFVLILTYMMTEIETNMQTPPQTKPRAMTQHYENWIVQHRKNAEENHMQDVIYACVTLQKINTALMLYDELPGKHVMPILHEHFGENQRSEEPLEAMIQDLFDGQREALEELTENETLDDNKKLKRLAELLIELFLDKPGSKGLLLMRSPLTVEGFIAFIKTQDMFKGLIKPAKTSTDSEQELNMISFQEDDVESFNLLVATGLAQETLDMPRCDFVISYSIVSNEIGSENSKGRAYAKTSEWYLIIDKNSAEESKHLVNLQKEHMMMETLSELDHFDQQELNKSISQTRVKLFERDVMQQERKSVDMDNFGSGNVTVHCRKCKQLLCDGAELRKRGSNVTARDVASGIKSKVQVRPYSSKRDFRDHIQLGELLCARSSCKQRIGHQVVHKSGDCDDPNMLSQNAVDWKHKEQGTYRQIKKWAEVPFVIDEY